MTRDHRPTFREAHSADIASIFDVRTAVRENHLGAEGLAARGITPQSVAQSFEGHSRGWVADVDGRIAGFAIADRSSRSIFALFIHPDFDGRGLGTRLLRLAASWLMPSPADPIWLTTGQRTKAETFYRRRGWRQVRIEDDGQIRFEWSGNDLIDGPMIDLARLDLVPLKDAAHFEPYHRIRRIELFERYEGPSAIYDPGVAGEDRPENLGHVLLLDDAVIGTIRIDLIDRDHAGFRLVAVSGDHKNLGYGAFMMDRAETIARGYGRREAVVNASLPARAFYERHGYRDGEWYDRLPIDTRQNVRLGKRLG